MEFFHPVFSSSVFSIKKLRCKDYLEFISTINCIKVFYKSNR